MRRFYLKQSALIYPPSEIFQIALFLAAKADNALIPLDTYLKHPDITLSREQIIALEFTLSRALEFTFTVYRALSSLHGLYLDMQDILVRQRSTLTIEELGVLHDKTRDAISNSSILLFTLSPGQIALGALYNINQQIVQEYLGCKLVEQSDEMRERIYDAVRRAAHGLKELESEVIITDGEASKILDACLEARKCLTTPTPSDPPTRDDSPVDSDDEA